MPKAEAGSTKYLNNKLKSKGLQRLRWLASAPLLYALGMLTISQVLPGKLLPFEVESFALKNVQICEKQCRDENGFKCHTQAESHVRNALLVGEVSVPSPNQKHLLSLTLRSRTLENTSQTSQISSKRIFYNSFVPVMWRNRCI